MDQHSRVPEVQLASSRTWDQLPEEYRQIIVRCARESALYQRELWREQETQSRADVIAAGALEIVLTPDERAQFRQTVQPLYEKYCGEYMELIDKIRQG